MGGTMIGRWGAIPAAARARSSRGSTPRRTDFVLGRVFGRVMAGSSGTRPISVVEVLLASPAGTGGVTGDGSFVPSRPPFGATSWQLVVGASRPGDLGHVPRGASPHPQAGSLWLRRPSAADNRFPATNPG